MSTDFSVVFAQAALSNHTPLSPAFLKKHASEPLQNMLEASSHFQNTRLEKIECFTNVVAGLITQKIECSLSTPILQVNLISLGGFQQIVQENMPTHCTHGRTEYSAPDRSFKWTLVFSFDDKTHRALADADLLEEQRIFAARTKTGTAQSVDVSQAVVPPTAVTSM